MKNRRIGFSHERDLVLKLWNNGFAVIRSPASGSKAKRYAVPDVVAIKNGKVFVFEVKTAHKKKTIYIPKHQIDKLLIFSRRSGGIPLIAVKIVGETDWLFMPVDDLEYDGEYYYRLNIDNVKNIYVLGDLLNMSDGA